MYITDNITSSFVKIENIRSKNHAILQLLLTAYYLFCIYKILYSSSSAYEKQSVEIFYKNQHKTGKNTTCTYCQIICSDCQKVTFLKYCKYIYILLKQQKQSPMIYSLVQLVLKVSHFFDKLNVQQIDIYWQKNLRSSKRGL